MRIAFFTDTFLPQINGVATSVATLAQELGRQGHEVILFAPAPARATRGTFTEFSAVNVTLIMVRSIPLFFYPGMRVGFLSFFTAWRHFRRFRPDIIHVHTPLSIGIGGLLVAKIFRIPLVGTNHVYLTKNNIGFLDSVYGSQFLKRLIARVFRGYMYGFYGRCDCVCTPSRELVTRMKSDGFRKPLLYLSNGIRIDDFAILSPENRAAMRATYGLQGKVVLHVGRLSAEKNVDVLIRAFAFLDPRLSVSLLIVGGGPAAGDLQALAEELGQGKRIVFAGMIEHRSLLASGIVSIADLFVTASTMEAQGMVVLEAMTSGLPVVCVGEAGVSELIDGNGVLVAPHDIGALADAMQQVLIDDALRERMAKKSLLLADAYAVSRIAEQLIEYYKGIAMRK